MRAGLCTHRLSVRLGPFTAIVLSGLLTVGCNSAPAGPAAVEDITTAAEVRFDVSSRSNGARAAVIIRELSCLLADGDGEFILADRNVVIATQSTRLNTTLTCKVKHVANSTGGAVRYTSADNPFGAGAQCGIVRPGDFVVTSDWTETVSSSGNATLRCRFKL